MQRTGVSWVIYTMTHSTFMLGLTVFAAQFPSFLFSLLGGIVSDRYNRYKVLMITQTAAMIQAVLLAVLTLTHHDAVWQILALSVILGIINAFDVPARQPLVHELIQDKADLPNALALNSSMNNLARLLGPALSGIVLVRFGAGICFLLNALSFVAVLISLFLIKLPARQPTLVKKDVRAELKEGFVYLKETPAIGLILLLLGLMSFMLLPYDTLLPVFAKLIFHGDAATFGYINSFIGLGAVLGSFFLASRKAGTDLKFLLLVNIIIFGICLLCFSRISYFPVAMLFAVLTGYGTMSITTICITILQVEAAPAMRGRVISYLAMAFFGMLPVGSLLIGFISQQIGAPNALLCQGIMALIIALIFSKFLRHGK
jgi:MFS family permease